MMIHLNNISYCYPDGTAALRNIDFCLHEGEKMVITGSNGAGKSTLFLILNGLLKPQMGNYYFEGKRVEYTKKALWHLRTNVGVVFQEPDSQIFSTNVIDEITFGLLNMGLPTHEVRARALMALQALDIEPLKNRAAHLLSYGQKKRVTIASVLAMNPKILILDEPTSGLDPAHAREMIALLDKLHQQGKTIVISTHDMNLAYDWASRLVILNNGEILGDGTVNELFHNQSIIDQSQLEKPLILQLYKALGHTTNTTKASVNELVEIIKAKR